MGGGGRCGRMAGLRCRRSIRIVRVGRSLEMTWASRVRSFPSILCALDLASPLFPSLTPSPCHCPPPPIPPHAQADPPDFSRIPPDDVVGVTVILLTCSYRSQVCCGGVGSAVVGAGAVGSAAARGAAAGPP